MTVWLVVYSNYYPNEVDSVWRTERKAQARARELGSPWHAEEWEVEECVR